MENLIYSKMHIKTYTAGHDFMSPPSSTLHRFVAINDRDR